MGHFAIIRDIWLGIAIAATLAIPASAQSAMSRSSNLLWQRSNSNATFVASSTNPAGQSALQQIASVTRPTQFQTAHTQPGASAIGSEVMEPPAPGGSSAWENQNWYSQQASPMFDDLSVDESAVQMGCESCGSETGCCCRPVGYLLDWSRCDLQLGVTSFTSASNYLTSGSQPLGKIEGSFGFQGGFNFGSRVPGLLGGQVGSQIGLRAITAQLHGSSAGEDSRSQLFLTAGLFRRVDYGVQGGMVVDYLHDNGLISIDLLQLRGELSFLMSPCHDAGLRFTSSQRTAISTTQISGITAPVTTRLTALDTYRFFYRYRFGDQGRGLAEVHGGFSEDRDGIVGVSLAAPLQGSVGLLSSMTYVIPHQNSLPKYTSEAWNIGVALVWTPGRKFGSARDYYRPLFEVADNGSLIAKGE